MHVDGVKGADHSGVIVVAVRDGDIIRQAGQLFDHSLDVVETLAGIDEQRPVGAYQQILGVHAELVNEIRVVTDADDLRPGDGAALGAVGRGL